ncbi:MAG: hypothetical protein CMO80_10470 [Verrucomicrobiales bacterium]|nr:hypothetical protein [Verrucomicrobiales bacterium]
MTRILAVVLVIVVLVWLVKRYLLPLMPTFVQQLFSYSLDAEMKVLAMDAVSRAKEEYRAELTYDRSSVKVLEERILKDLHHNHLIEPLSAETLMSESQLWGAYLGEVLRRIRDGKWREKSSQRGKRAMPFKFSSRGEVFPCDWVLRRIKHGDEFNLAEAIEEYVKNRDNAAYTGLSEEA